MSDLTVRQMLKIFCLALGGLLSACGGGSGGASGDAPPPEPDPPTIPPPTPGTIYVSGPTDQDSATVSLQGRDLVLSRGTEAGVEYLSHQGLARSYVVIRPQSLSSRQPTLVILHGNNSHPQEIANISQAAALVASRNAVVVLPEALDARWSEDPADSRGIDDVGFLGALTQALVLRADVQASQLYLAGFSNGGAMVQRQACADPTRFAAYGVVAAVLRPGVAALCASAPARPIAYMLGTLDPVVVFEGVSGFSSAASSVAHWVQAQGCGEARQETLPNTTADGTTTDLFRYPGCAQGNELRFYRINAGGHAWPGGAFQGLVSSIGLTPRDYSATEAFWDYFLPYRID